MTKIDPTRCRIDTLIGTLLYMMTAYQRRCCRNLARSIAAHLECLAHHPDDGETVRQVVSGMCSEWKRASAVATSGTSASAKTMH